MYDHDLANRIAAAMTPVGYMQILLENGELDHFDNHYRKDTIARLVQEATS